jgi:Ca2+-binding EF-hand superfamily protein
VIIRAFNAAKVANDAANKKTGDKHGQDYIEKSEFRLLVCYMRKYLELWEMFQEIDVQGDRKVTLKEFNQAVPKIAHWGLKVTDPAKTFGEIDADKGGCILFGEFADWALKLSLDLEGHEKFDDEAMHHK